MATARSIRGIPRARNKGRILETPDPGGPESINRFLPPIASTKMASPCPTSMTVIRREGVFGPPGSVRSISGSGEISGRGGIVVPQAAMRLHFEGVEFRPLITTPAEPVELFVAWRRDNDNPSLKPLLDLIEAEVGGEPA